MKTLVHTGVGALLGAWIVLAATTYEPVGYPNDCPTVQDAHRQASVKALHVVFKDSIPDDCKSYEDVRSHNRWMIVGFFLCGGLFGYVWSKS